MAFPVRPADDLAAGGWRLRALSEEHWPLEWAMSRDPEVVRWTLYPPDMSDEAARARIQRTGQLIEDRIAARYAVLDSGGNAVGTAGIAAGESPESAEIFYALLPSGRHRGAATAAARALTDWALSIGIERVQLLTIPGNSASEKVAHRAGFVPDGEETRDQRGTPTRMLRWRRDK